MGSELMGSEQVVSELVTGLRDSAQPGTPVMLRENVSILLITHQLASVHSVMNARTALRRNMVTLATRGPSALNAVVLMMID